MMLDIDQKLQQAANDMNMLTDELLKTGFSEEQWELISDYICTAIGHSQWAYAKAGQLLT